jgi:hypothetical protein
MSRTNKKFLAMVAVCSAGMLFQTGLVPTSCAQYYGQALLTSLDFCSIFNCTSGTFSNLCEPIPLFVDCPNYQAATP